ncbi:MAG: hypothetical protein FWD17_06095, partial [Polyangiaceae bacterium]|nr:hypothetical protein [Polyangiaceae bacterium]
VSAAPQLFDSTGAPFASPNGAPIMLPTALPDGFVDPTYVTNPTASSPQQFTSEQPSLQSAELQAIDAGPLLPSTLNGAGVRFSFDDPTAHIDQSWTVTYEGALPTAIGLVADMSTDDGYQTVVLQPWPSAAVVEAGTEAGATDAAVSNGARYCSRGIEDWNAGQQRIAALRADGRLTLPPDQEQFTADYVEITDDVLNIADSYWETMPDCWDFGGKQQGRPLANVDPASVPSRELVGLAQDRYNYCFQQYNSSGNADTTFSRDFPVLEATDGTLRIGTFVWPAGIAEDPTNRTILGKDSNNVFALKQAACCFHHQPHFKVRTGGEWVAAAAPVVGLLNHVGIDPTTGACRVRCDDPTQALMNSRAFEVASDDNDAGAGCGGPLPPGFLDAIGRDSPFAMRNPMFSFVMWQGCGRNVRTPRDAQWRFTSQGGFTPLSLALGGTTAVSVAPESIVYIGPFNQLAVVDGSQQGLIIIDVNSLQFAHDPYF